MIARQFRRRQILLFVAACIGLGAYALSEGQHVFGSLLLGYIAGVVWIHTMVLMRFVSTWPIIESIVDWQKIDELLETASPPPATHW